MQQIPASTRFHGLDSLRAAMMLLGIVLHSATTYVRAPLGRLWPFKDQFTTPVCDLMVLTIHLFRMPLFFLLAGFFACLLYRKLGAGGFLWHRAKRILLPFAVGWLVLYLPTVTGMVYGRSAGSGNPGQAVAEYLRSGEYLQPPRTIHLWFLYYLLYFSAAAAVLGRLGGSDRLRRVFRRVISSPWRTVILALPTAGVLFFMRSGGFDTDPDFAVNPLSLGAYGLFFGFGWLLYGERDLLGSFERFAWRHVITAAVLLPIHIGAVRSMLREGNARAHVIAVLTGALVTWLLVSGLMGLAERYWNRESARVRYMADASYWMYLVHLPIVLWVQSALVGWEAPGLLKFAVTAAATTAIAGVTYHTLVRYTVIGEILNGKRQVRSSESGRRDPASQGPVLQEGTPKRGST